MYKYGTKNITASTWKGLEMLSGNTQSSASDLMAQKANAPVAMNTSELWAFITFALEYQPCLHAFTESLLWWSNMYSLVSLCALMFVLFSLSRSDGSLS